MDTMMQSSPGQAESAPTPSPDTVALAERWMLAKRDEQAANARRLKLEGEIIAALAFTKQEGQQTFKPFAGVAITLKAALNRKLDFAAWDATIAAQFPADLVPIKTKRELDATGVKWLEKNRPDLYALLVPALTTTPAKIAVEVTFAD